MTVLAVTLAAVAAWLMLAGRPRAPSPAPATGRRWWLLVAAAAAAALPVAGPALLLAPLLGWAVPALLRVRRRRHEAAATAERVLEACELLAAEVAAGRPPIPSLMDAAAAWPTLRPVAEAATLGGDVPRALRRVATAPGAGDLALVAAAWAVAHRTGGGLGDALARVAATIRADRATRRVVDGELASARATARLIAVLPVLVLLLGSGADAGTWRFLLDTPTGLACLGGGLGLGLVGLWWIERIADGVGP